MKKLILTGIGVFFVLFINAQTITYTPSNLLLNKFTTINFSKATTAGVTGTTNLKLSFRIDKITDGENITVKISDNDEGTTLAADYKIETDITKKIDLAAVTDNTTASTFDLLFSKVPVKNTSVVLNITISNGSKLNDSYKITLLFNSATAKATTQSNDSNAPAALSDTSKWTLGLIAGSNFDFFNGTPKFQNFAGEITASLPDIYKKLGLQLGLFNYHYFQSDSSASFKSSNYYFLTPEDYYNQQNTSKVVRQDYYVNRKVDYNIWGAYVDPLYELTSNQFAQVYLSLHLEGLLTTYTYTPTVTNTTKDTLRLNQLPATVPKSSVGAHPEVAYSYKQATYYDFYLGAGMPLKVNLTNKFRVALSPTVGEAFIQSQTPSSSLDYDERFNISSGTIHKPFFLTKYQVATTVAAVDIALGGEYRVVVGNLHYLTTYIGASITLDKYVHK